MALDDPGEIEGHKGELLQQVEKESGSRKRHKRENLPGTGGKAEAEENAG